MSKSSFSDVDIDLEVSERRLPIERKSGQTVLFVTRKSSSKVLSWAEVVTSASMALERWRERRHDYVFADFGDLGEGMTGARLAAALRKESADVVIILLADKIQPHHKQWAKNNGANDVAERSVRAIAECFLDAAPSIPTRPSEYPSGFPPDETVAGISALIDRRLQKYGRLGPVRTLVIEDALARLMKVNDAAPTLNELAREVAKDIPSELDRAAFLNSFSITNERLA